MASQASLACFLNALQSVIVDYETGNIACDAERNSLCQNTNCECDIKLAQNIVAIEEVVNNPEEAIGVKADSDMGHCRKGSGEKKQKPASSPDRAIAKAPKVPTKCCKAGEGEWILYKPDKEICDGGMVISGLE